MDGRQAGNVLERLVSTAQLNTCDPSQNGIPFSSSVSLDSVDGSEPKRSSSIGISSHSSFWWSHTGSAFSSMNWSTGMPSTVGGRFILACLPFIKTHWYFLCRSACAAFFALFWAGVSCFLTFAIAKLFGANCAYTERCITPINARAHSLRLCSQLHRPYPTDSPEGKGKISGIFRFACWRVLLSPLRTARKALHG